MHNAVLLAFALTLGACASKQPAPPTCDGALVPINVSQQQGAAR